MTAVAPIEDHPQVVPKHTNANLGDAESTANDYQILVDPADQECLYPRDCEHKNYAELYDLKLNEIIADGRFSIISKVNVHAKHKWVPEGEQVVAKIIHLRSIASAQKKLDYFMVMHVLAAQLSIPTCIKAHHIYKIADHLVIFMRYMESGNARQFLSNNGPASVERARRWTYQIGDALYHLHSNGIAHRNIRLSNILLDYRLNAYLSGFSSAKIVFNSEEKKLLLCKSYTGALPYMAPELFSEQKYEARLSDVWSLGVCLYQLLLHRYPFDITCVKTLRTQQTYGAWRIKDYYGIISGPLLAVIEKIFTLDPRKRPDIAEVLNSEWFAGQNHGAHAT